jgi:hypothetical protein
MTPTRAALRIGAGYWLPSQTEVSTITQFLLTLTADLAILFGLKEEER